MKNPKFLLQSGNILSTEKVACISTVYPYVYCDIRFLSELNVEESKFNYVPVGSVEYVKEYCNHVGLSLPNESITYDYVLDSFIKRKIRFGKLCEALDEEFVKPKSIKIFTGDIKSNLRPLNPETEVWISESVPFESEFRFYIQDYVNKWEILGWSRYDDSDIVNPSPDLDYVNSICKEIHESLGPSAYSIDIGWRSDIQEYDVVELNDAWSLGLYLNHDSQSQPPSREDYANMLISRWAQILFCNLV